MTSWKNLCLGRRLVLFALLGAAAILPTSGCSEEPEPPTEEQVEKALEIHRERAQRERDEG